MRPTLFASTTLLLAVVIVMAGCAPADSPVPSPQATEPSPKETASPSAPPTAAPPTGPQGEITMALSNDPVSFEVMQDAFGDVNLRMVAENIYETLVTRDPETMEIVPSLAESWEQVDETTWRFTLRKGVTFHNGEDYDADAVVFSVQRQTNPDLNFSVTPMYYTLLAGAEAVDDYTVDITTNGYDPLLPARMCWLQMMPPEYLTDDPEAHLERPIGTGPYRFVEMAPAQQIVLEANEDYWGEMPSIARVTLKPIPEAATALSALQTGEIDFVRDVNPASADSVPQLASGPGVEFPMMRLQTVTGPLADPVARRALNYAVEREALASVIFGGFARPTGQVAASGIFGYNPHVEPYPYDPAMAKDLLAEAGAEGATLRLVCPSEHWLNDREVCQAVASQLQEIGLDIHLEMVDWNSWIMEIIADPESQPDIIYMSQSSELLDADTNLSSYFSQQYSIAANWDDPTLNELMAREKVEPDPTVREELLQQALEHAHNEAPFLFLLHADNIYGLADRLVWSPRLDGRILVSEMSLR